VRSVSGLPYDAANDIEEHRRQKNAEQGHADHAGEYRHAEGLAHLSPGPVGDHQRKHAEDEGIDERLDIQNACGDRSRDCRNSRKVAFAAGARRPTESPNIGKSAAQ
jgi:hypothetical protein